MSNAAMQNYGRTTVDVVTDYLMEEISSLRLLPGTKISEADIAAQFSVSRQPVRDAFNRLANLDLLMIRPQRATEVRRFSAAAIEKSRYIRAAIEMDVLRRAAAACDAADAANLDKSLELQEETLAADDYASFSKLDYRFHRLLCDIAKAPFAFDVISEEKAKVDRLCLLGLANESRMPELIADHAEIARLIKMGHGQAAIEVGQLHLARLDSTIEAIKQEHPGYFDDAD